MLSYKYSFDEVYDRPLVPDSPNTGRMGIAATFILLPILAMIGIVLMIYSPVKGVQLLIEKFID